MKKNRIIWLAITAILLILEWVFQCKAIFLFLGGLILYVCIDSVLGYYLLGRLNVEFEVPEFTPKKTPVTGKVIVGGKIPFGGLNLDLVITNRLTGQRRKTTLNILGEENSVEFHMNFMHCGLVTIEVERIGFYDSFKLTNIGIKKNFSAQIMSMPTLFEQHIVMNSGSNFDLEALEYSKYKPGDDPSEIFDIREYEKGDSLRRIHWKLTGKHNKLMVLRPSLPMDNKVLLAYENGIKSGLDIEDSSIDKSMDIMVTTSYTLIENEIKHTLCWFDNMRDEVMTFNIEEEDDIYSILSSLLSCGLCQNDKALLDEIDNLGSYSHVITITPGDEIEDFKELLI